MKSFALGSLFCIFALSVTPATYSQGVSPAASNPYAVAGEQFLLQVQQAFLQPKLPKDGFTLPLYADDIDPLTGTQLTGNAALWADETMIHALYWGTQVFPDQFKPLLSTSVDQLAWYQYQSAHGKCFGTTANATCFFDDNVAQWHSNEYIPACNAYRGGLQRHQRRTELCLE
jgi:hypothetical protein